MLNGKSLLASMPMMQSSSSALQSQWQDNYNDLANLNEINKLGDKDKDAALRKVAEKFESMFLSMMLKSMRDANAVFEDDNEMNSFALGMHRDMSDQQLVLNLSGGRGIGLADSFYQQMKSSYGGALGIPDNGAQNSDSDGARSVIEQLRKRLVNAAPSPIEAEQDNTVAINHNFTSQSEFVETLLPLAEKYASRIGVDPKLLVAQAALETGWGKFVVRDANGENTFNLFNIKADSRWDGPSATVGTLEYRDGIAKREQASFRKYASFADSFADYADFVTNSERYKPALAQAHDPIAYASALQAGGYATDPDYAKKIKAIFFSESLSGNDKRVVDLASNGIGQDVGLIRKEL